MRLLPFAIAASTLVGLGASAASAATEAGAPVAASSYIIRFTPASDARNEVATLKSAGIGVSRVFENVFPGAVVQANEKQVDALRKNPRVAVIEPDSRVALEASQSGAPWGLDRIDQRGLPLSGSFNYTVGSSSVTAYVIDTGVLASHSDFAGRVTAGFTSISDANGTSDCNGHGTHVAGTIGGNTYGVAKTASIVPVRVLDCAGSGTWSGVIAGLDWIVAHHPAGVPAVANMSLGGGASSSVDAAVQSVINDGVTVVVAAGNSNVDACGTSPARVPGAITVAASDSADTRASFSNFGTCVDIFAPGVAITSAWSNGATNTISGTSMASPHVAGAAALLLSSTPTTTPADLASRLLNSATQGVVKNAGTGSPNRLLFAEYVADPTPITAPSAPTNVNATGGKRSASVSWTAGSNGGSPITAFVVSVYSNGARIGTVSVAGTSTKVTVTGLAGNNSYSFTVRATNAAGSSPESTQSNTVAVRR